MTSQTINILHDFFVKNQEPSLNCVVTIGGPLNLKCFGQFCSIYRLLQNFRPELCHGVRRKGSYELTKLLRKDFATPEQHDLQNPEIKKKTFYRIFHQ